MPLMITGMYVAGTVQPRDQFPHEPGHVLSWRRYVDRLAGRRVDDVVLHAPVRARRRRSAAHASHQAPVDFPDEPLGDRPRFVRQPAVAEVCADERERVTEVEHLAGVVRVRSRHLPPRQHTRRVLQRQPRALDMRRMVRFQQKRPRAHLLDPRIRQRRPFQKPPRPLDLGEGRGDCVRDGKARSKGH